MHKAWHRRVGVFADRIGRRTAYVLFGLVEIGIGLFGAVSSWIFYDVLFGRFVGFAQSPAVVFAAAFAGSTLGVRLRARLGLPG
jgi:hypothetical protein